MSRLIVKASEIGSVAWTPLYRCNQLCDSCAIRFQCYTTKHGDIFMIENFDGLDDSEYEIIYNNGYVIHNITKDEYSTGSIKEFIK